MIEYTGLCAAAMLGVLAAAAPTGAPAVAGAAVPDDVPHTVGGRPWDARAVRHLMNRAGFGVPQREIAALVARSPEHVIDELLEGGREVEPFLARRFGMEQYRRMGELTPEQDRRARTEIRRNDRGQLLDYGAWWAERMLEGSDPLRDRMTLFWHGFFTTAARELRRNYEVIRQHQFLRENALESYAVLLAGIVRDPAMLHYLDNASNRAGNPNENLARELMELFSLGEGNFTETDVREVARALTGFAPNRDGEFTFARRQHDAGEKRILGEVGKFNGDDVVRILLAQDACARWVARSVIAHLEGPAPSEERLERYAALLRANEYRLRPFLRELLLDADFYRPEAVGTRVAGPIDFVVGSSRRLGLRPPGRYVFEASASLGQRMFDPPNVEGWDEGEAWITTASMLQRGNVAGLLLGVLDFERALPGGAGRELQMEAEGMDAEMGASMDRDMDAGMDAGMDARRGPMAGRGAAPPRDLRTLRRAAGEGYRPPINLTWRMAQAGARTDAALVDRMLEELLAIEPPADARPALLRFLRAERAAAKLPREDLLLHPEVAEDILRRLAHLILSLPEAQLG